MIQTVKKVFTKLVPALVGIFMLTGFMVVGFENNLAGMVVIAQASPVDGLNLSEQQKTEIQAIFRQTNNQTKQLKANTHIAHTPFTRSQAQQQIKELFKQIETKRTDALVEVRNQLNSIQQATFDQLTAKIKEAGENQTEMLKNLELTQQQKMKIARAVEQSREQIWGVLGDSTLSKEQKITQIKNMKQNATNTIREQLTTGQQKEFDAWRQQQQENFAF